MIRTAHRIAPRLLAGLLATSALAPAAAFGQALPQGGSVVSGQVDIGAPAQGQMTIRQGSDRAIVNWNSFSIGKDGRVTIEQPNAQSALLNRVTGTATSEIAGALSANGQVFLVNPNGILIQPGGSINAAGFVASTLDIADQDFLDGRIVVTGKGGSVDNRGTISIARGGYAGLIGGRVENHGLIIAPLGKVALGAGTQATLDFEGDGFLQVALPAAEGGVYMPGRITADGGAVILSAASAREAARGVVNLSGVIEARGIDARGGSVTLTGGDISLTSATIDVSGTTGGGRVRIGGGRQGGEGLMQADTLAVDAASTIRADASGAGDGGDVVLWASDSTRFAGTISARGAGGGNGGEAEVSGKRLLAYSGHTDLTGARFGNLLLDPYNLTIAATGGNTGGSMAANTNDSVIDIATLQAALATASVTLSTGSGGSQAGDITVAAPITVGAGRGLTLQAARSILINANIALVGAGSLTFTTGAGGELAMGNGATVSFASAGAGSQQLTINGEAYTLVRDLVGLQAMANLIDPSSRYAIVADIDASASATMNGGLGFAPIGGTPANPFFGDYTGSFEGVLNGLGHVVSGLTISRPTQDNIGLFGYGAPTSRISDVQLRGASMVGQSNVGALIGATEGLVSRTSSTGSVSGRVAGGLVGLISEGTLTGSWSAASITGTGDFVGGLLGATFMATVRDSYATGEVTAGAFQNIGGLVGMNQTSTLGNVYATGNVYAPQAFSVGGLVGYALGTSVIQDAFATGVVIGRNEIGGLVGWQTTNSTITRSFATGAVACASSCSNIGGLVSLSMSDASVSSSYWDTQTSGLVTSPGGGTGLTTAQLQSGSASALGARFAGGAGGLYPYLSSFFANGVQAISGTAYAGSGATLGSSGAGLGQVTLLVDGQMFGGRPISTGANGYYYAFAAAGSLPASAQLLAYTTDNAATGATVGATVLRAGQAPGLRNIDVKGGWLINWSDAPTLAAVYAGAAEVDAATLPTFLASALPSLRRDIRLTAPVVGVGGALAWDKPGNLIVRAQAFDIDLALSLAGSSSLTLQAAGTITGNAAITHSGTGTLSLTGNALAFNAPLTVTGAGTLALGYDTADPTNLTFATGASARFTGTPGTQSLTINGQAYELLYSAADLQGINTVSRLSGRYALAGGVDLAGMAWQPIGREVGGAGAPLGDGFTGALEGLGNSIRNLTIDAIGARQGLFGVVSGGTIRDLHLTNANVTGWEETGLLVGYMKGIPSGSEMLVPLVANVTVEGKVVGNGTVGGVIGSTLLAQLDHIVAHVDVDGGNYGEVGGIVGNARTSGNSAFRALAAFGTVRGASMVGGLIGSAGMTSSNARGAAPLSQSIFVGSVTSSGTNVGGLIGYGTTFDISDSAAFATVSGRSYVGGIVGYGFGYVTNVFGSGAVYSQGRGGGAFGELSPSEPTVGVYWNSSVNRADMPGARFAEDATALTGTQMRSSASFAGYDFAANGPWGIIEGSSMPYLRWLYGDAPSVVSGKAYTDAGATVLRSQSGASGTPGWVNEAITAPGRVSITVDGKAMGNAYTGYDGSYYFLLPTGTVAAGGSSVLASVQTGAANAPGAVSGATALHNLAGSVTNADIWGGYRTLQTAGPSYAASIGADAAAAGSDPALAALLGSLANLRLLGTGSRYAIDRAITLDGAHGLDISSAGTLAINAPITVTGAGALSLRYAVTTGAYQGDDFTVAMGAGIQFTGTPHSGETLSINGESYSLLYSLDELRNIDPLAIHNFALARSLDASGYGNWAPLDIPDAAGGIRFEGLGNTISHLNVTASANGTGLFGYLPSSVVRNLGLTDITAFGAGSTGAIAGVLANGAVWNSYATGTISGNNFVGGIVGSNIRSIVGNVMFSGVVSGWYSVGGIVGGGDGDIRNAYSEGVAYGLSVGGINGDGNRIQDVVSNMLVTPVDGVSGGGLFSATGIATGAYWNAGINLAGTMGGGNSFQAVGVAVSGADARKAASYALGTGWSIIEGVSLPYLTSLFPSGPTIVSGTVYADAGVTPAGNGPYGNGLRAVSFSVNGVWQGNAYLGADGSWYRVLAGGALSAPGSQLIAYANDSAALVQGSAASRTGVDLWRNWLRIDTDASALSSVDAALATSMFPVASFPNWRIAAAGGSFAIDRALTRDGLILEGGASFTQSAQLQASTLRIGDGSFALTNPYNRIDTLRGTASALDFVNTGDLTIAGLATSGALSVRTDGALTLAASGTVTGADPRLAAATIVNQRGADAVSASVGRWLIYLSAPAGNSFGNLDSQNNAIWNTGAMAAVSQPGNRYVFAYRPTLSLTSRSQSAIYGDAVDLSPLYQVSGLMPGVAGAYQADTLGAVTSGAMAISSPGAAVTADVGIYGVNIAQGTLAATTGYALAFQSTGTLTRTARPITVTAGALSRIYGDTNPALTYAIGGMGLANGDMLFGGLTTSAGPTSNVGIYAIGQGTLAASANYALSYVGADLTITPRPITVTADMLSRIYGEANPALSYAIGGMGLANGDTLTGGLTTLAGVTSNVGTYAIGQGTLAASANYALTYVGAQLAVTPRPITVTADMLSRIYGEANPALTYAIGGMGLTNGDALIGGLATLANAISNVGTYAIGQGTLAASANYALTYVGAQLAVTPRPITVTADVLSRIYGEANPTLSYAISGMGLTNGDTLTGSLATLANATSNVGAYAIGQGTLAASTNYALTYAGAQLSVTARPITITAGALSRIYGEANPALTYAIGGMGLANGDTLTGGLATSAGLASAIGNWTITLGDLSAGANYALSYTGADLTITPRPVTITADSLSRFYGETNPALTYAIGGMGLANGDALAGGLTTLANLTSNIGGYAIGQGTLAASSNYALSYVGAQLIVTPRPITVTADALSRIYGEANPALSYAIGGMGLANGDTLTGGLTTLAGASSNVGTYAIGQGTLAASANYALTYVGAQLAVTPRPITITADTLSRIYGEADPALTYAIGGMGLTNGDALTGSLATLAGLASNVGSYTIDQGTLAAPANYALTYVGAQLAVAPRQITITADTLSRIYGEANPALTYAIGGMGLVNGDTLTGGLGTLATRASSIGNWAIGLGSLAAGPNYAITYNAADLAIAPRPITVTADALSRFYGEANPALTYAIGGMGLVNGDTLTGALATLATALSDVGSYAISQGSLVASPNYVVTFGGAQLGIVARPITVTADALTRFYGEANPALTYTVGGMGLANGDTLIGGLSTAATSDSHIGAYAIDQASLRASSNYVVTYVGGNLMVTPRPVTVTADTLSRTYGEANPALGYTVGGMGLANGDQLSGGLVTAAAIGSGVGSYAIGQGTLAASTDYVLTFVGAFLAITPRPITVTADSQSRIYGESNPALSYAIGGMGLVNGDGLVGSLSTRAGAGSDVGAWAIERGTLAASGNYTLTYAGATLLVTPRPVSVTADAATRIYGEVTPPLSYTIGGMGLVNGDQLSGALATSATERSNIGSYAIGQGSLASSPNYAISYTGAALVITPRPIIVTADTLSRIYGESNPALTYTIGGMGLANGDALTGALATIAGPASGIGSYTIDRGTLASSANYAMSFVGARLSIAPRPLLITADSLSRFYGLANPPLTYVIGDMGLANGDTLTGALTTAALPESPLGRYLIRQGSLAASSNYTLRFVDGVLAVIPSPALSGDQRATALLRPWSSWARSSESNRSPEEDRKDPLPGTAEK